MADDDSKKPPASDFERMSLASLKRELASQQATTEQQRADAKERLRAESEKSKAFPWGTLAAVVVGGAVFFVLVAFGLEASFPEVSDYMIPDFVYHPYDGGPPRVYPDAAHVDAGTPDTGAAAAAHHPHHGTGTHAPTPGGDLELDTTGGSDDPLEGL
jgi:hypothetical protein